MKKYDDIDASVTNDLSQSNIAGPPNDQLHELRDATSATREDALIENEALLLIREKAVAAREDAIHLREEAVIIREREILALEMAQTTSDNHMVVLQQANEHLVIATLEAQTLAQQLELTTVQLESAKRMAEKANLAKSEFLSRMSHELRTPLNAILGFAQLLESGTPHPTPIQLASINKILQAGWYLLDLINEILDLATIESGKLPLSMAPILLSEVMQDCRHMIEPQAEKNGIRIRFPHFDLPCFVFADRTAIKQILINLLSNAIKYNRANGTVEVTCIPDEAQRVRISVRDTGNGLPPEKIAQLFQPFNRLGQEAKTTQGTGIGLAVSKRLVEAMEGAIGMESTVGVGSIFWIELKSAREPQLETGADS